jgi:drug/metabolite transporter (DMT)-like permease
MNFLSIAILLNTLIFVIFSLFPRMKVNTLQAIVVNYLVCAAIGIYFVEDPNQFVALNFQKVWVQTGAILGVLFVFTFYLIAYTTQACGISVATVANKISLVIPVFFSIYVFSEWKKSMLNLQFAGIVIALVAIIFASIQDKKKPLIKIPRTYSVLLPILIFIFGGAIDTLINYSKFYISTLEEEKIFTSIVFTIAAVTGLVALLIQLKVNRESFNSRSIFAGLLLGFPNYFSIFFLVKSLSAFHNNAAFVYPVINMGIIILSALVSIIAFREKLSSLNKIGIALALGSLILLSYKELLVWVELVRTDLKI